MTRKDYVRIAAALRASKPTMLHEHATYTWRMTCERIAGALYDDNHRFKIDVFYTACGYDRPRG